MCEMAHINNKTLSKKLDELKESGLICYVRKRHNNVHEYAVLMPGQNTENGTLPRDTGIPKTEHRAFQKRNTGHRKNGTGTNRVPEEVPNKSPLRSTVISDETELPFTSEAFQKAWCNWQTHQKERQKKLTPTTVKEQLKLLGEFGEAKAIATIEYNILNGWLGLYEPRNPTKPTTYDYSEGRN